MYGYIESCVLTLVSVMLFWNVKNDISSPLGENNIYRGSLDLRFDSSLVTSTAPLSSREVINRPPIFQELVETLSLLTHMYW